MDTLISTLAIGIIGIFLIGLIIGVINYFFQSIGLYKLGKNEGIKYNWLSWIPMLNVLVMFMLVEKEAHEIVRERFTLSFIIAYFVSMILSLFLAVFAIIPTIMIYYAFYLIAKKYSDREVLHLVIAIITIGLSIPLQLFIFRNREARVVVN